MAVRITSGSLLSRIVALDASSLVNRENLHRDDNPPRLPDRG